MATIVHVAVYAARHPAVAGIALAALVAVVFACWRAAAALARRARSAAGGRKVYADDVSMRAAAAIGTAIAAQGMWVFFGKKLGLAGPERAAFFAYLEVLMVTFALRARRRQRDPQIGKPGMSGIMVWIIAATSGFLASLAAATFGGAVFRLAVPLLTALAWEQSLAIERHRVHGKRINWHWTPERIFVRLGMADPEERTTRDVDITHRLVVIARAQRRANARRARRGLFGLAGRLADRRLTAAVLAADENTGLATDPALQGKLDAHLRLVHSVSSLAAYEPQPLWGTGNDSGRDTKDGTAGDTSGDTGRGTAGDTSGDTAGGSGAVSRRDTGDGNGDSSWPSARGMSLDELVKLARPAARRYQQRHGKRLPAAQLGNALRLRISRDRAGEVLGRVYSNRSGTGKQLVGLAGGRR
jgi:hypothetical protein